MKIPGMIKFIVISAVIYKILTFKPIRRAIVGFAITTAANILRKQLS